MLLLVDEDVIIEAENTETKRSNGFGRIVKSPSRQKANRKKQSNRNTKRQARDSVSLDTTAL